MKTSEKFMYGLGALIILGFFIVLIGLIFVEVPQGNKDALYLALGTLFGSFTSIVGYFYGSSAGSKQKTELLAEKQNAL
jgi:hypothetical protein